MRQRQSLLCSTTLICAGILCSAVFGAEPGTKSASLLFAEDFASSGLDSAWTVHADKDNTLTVDKGRLVINARMNTRAHVERKLEIDRIRVSVVVKSESNRAAESLLIYWDASNFCEVGVNLLQSGRIGAREVLGTYRHDHDLGPAAVGQWNHLAIEIGQDCVRYLTSSSGGEFNCVRVSRRPERLAAAPKLLVVGQGAETKLFAAAAPFIKPALSKELIAARLKRIRIEKLEPPRDRASQHELQVLAGEDIDSLAEQELSADDDPTFESVARHFPPLSWPREAIGIKDHPFAIGVAHDGALQFTEASADARQPTGFFEIGEAAYRFGTGPTPCTRKLHKGYMPIVTLGDRNDGLEFQQTAFGYSKNFSPEEPLTAYVRFVVANTTDVPRKLKLRFRVTHDSKQTTPLSWDLEVPARNSGAVFIKAPYAILQSPAVEVKEDEYKAKLAEVAAYWDKLLDTGSKFEIPEPRVQDAYRAWLAYNFINVHKRGDIYHVCDGSGFYTKVYGYSLALYCNNMDLLGYYDLAEKYLDSLLTFMRPDGLLAVNFGDTDTGATLVSMSRHYWITRDADWLRRLAPKMIAMCNWIIETRKKTLAGAASQPALARGLIRYRPYADLLTPAADYFSNGYLCQGLSETAEVFAAVGLTDEAVRIKIEAERYRKDIAASMQAAVFEDGGTRVLPVVPDTRELWKESDGSANGYYAIIAPCMLEAGAPAWNAPEADLLIDVLRRRGGLTLGVPRFHEMIDHAYGYGYWMTCLQRDEVERVILGLYASMAFSATRDTYSAVECTNIRTGENFWTLPHTYSNTQQLRLLRNMLVREDGEDLWIGQAIPRPWLAKGKRVAVKAAPTLFGPVSFAIEPNADSVAVHLEPPTRNPPRVIRIRLRVPGQREIRSVDGRPEAAVNLKGDFVELTGLKGPVDLQIRY